METPSILLPTATGAFSLSAFNFAYQLLSVLDVYEPRHRIEIVQLDQDLGQIPAFHIRDGPVVSIEFEARVVDISR
jgi:hypothetical protein